MLGSHPELAHGRTVLAATVQVGRGRIAAFTDSTVWSSFAVFSHDREKLAMDLVGLLHRVTSPLEKPFRWAAMVAASLAAGICLLMVGSSISLPAILVGLIGFWSGVAVADACHRNAYAWPEPNVADF